MLPAYTSPVSLLLMTYPKESRNYTNPKKLLYEFPHPGLLPLEKVTMRTYWDWYYT